MINAFYAAEPKDGLVSMNLFDLSCSTDPAKVELGAIWSEVERGKGHASRALERLCVIADAHQVILWLEPHWLRYDTDPDRYSEAETDRLEALNDLNLSNEQLSQWYERHGFVSNGAEEMEEVQMHRPPRPL